MNSAELQNVHKKHISWDRQRSLLERKWRQFKSDVMVGWKYYRHNNIIPCPVYHD